VILVTKGSKVVQRRPEGLKKSEKDITSEVKDITCFHSLSASIIKTTKGLWRCGFAENRVSLSAE